MRSPAVAIGWEFRRRHRWGLIAVAGYLFVVATIRFLILGPGEAVLVDSARFAAVVSVPLTTTFVYLLAVFSFGFTGDLAARHSMYPARMFTLPVTNAALVTADALWHGGHGDPVAGREAFRRVAVGYRHPLDLAGATGRGPSRVDAGADVDAVWLAGDALDRRSALPGRAGDRRPGGNSFQGRRTQDGGHPGAAASPRISRRALRRCPGAPRRRARLAGTIRPVRRNHERPATPPRPLRFARARPSVVRVAAAWPVAAGARGSAAAIRARVAVARQGRGGFCLRNTVPRADHAAVHGRLHGVDGEQAASQCRRFLRRAPVHRDAAVDQRRAHRRQAEDGDVEHAGRVAAGARRDAARARVVGHLVRGDGTGVAHE